jgi:hypothetical protein
LFWYDEMVNTTCNSHTQMRDLGFSNPGHHKYPA